MSKQRNKHLQSMLIEAAKLAPRHNETLREVYGHERGRGPRSRATVAVARKRVAYLLAAGRRQRGFEALPPAAKRSQDFRSGTQHREGLSLPSAAARRQARVSGGRLRRETQRAGPCPGKKKKTFY